MAKLPFNMQGYAFQSALDILRKSFVVGSTALTHEITTLENQLRDYRQGGEFQGERDEEGEVLWDRDDLLRLDIASANNALMELRRAFAIAAYHHWERSVLSWNTASSSTNGDKKQPRCYPTLSIAATDVGYLPDPRLERVVKLANTLKHNSAKEGRRLYELWPDIFPLPYHDFPRLSDWVRAIQLTDQHMDEIFDTVSKSGPTVSW